MTGFDPLGGRSTAVRLDSSSLAGSSLSGSTVAESKTRKNVLLLCSTPCTPISRQAIDDLGKLSYILGGNLGHYMFIKEWTESYPDAVVIGVEGVQRMKACEGVRWDYLFSEGAGVGEGENPLERREVKDVLDHVWVDGFRTKDVVLFHRSTATLLQVDMLYNMPARDQFRNSQSRLIPNFYHLAPLFSPGSRMHRFVSTRVHCMDRDRLRVALERIAQWDVQRIVMCHGDVVHEGGKEEWEKVFGGLRA